MRTICILLAVLASAGIFGCYVFFTLIKSAVERAYTAEAAIVIQSAKKEQFQLIKSVLSEINPDIRSLSARLVDTEGTIAIIESVESLGRSIGMEAKINSVGVKGADPKSKDAKNQTTENLLLNFSVSGPWDKVYRFLKIVEHLPYKTSIQNVSLNRISADKVSVWNGSFSISILKNKMQ